MSVTILDAQVFLEGADISPYIISLKRNHDLCNIVQSFSLNCDKTLLNFLAGLSIKLRPSNPVTIYEMGVKKLTGHVRSVTLAREPDYVIKIDGTDTYKFLKDFFISDDIGKSNGESVAYWATRLVNMAGLSVSIDSPEIGLYTVAPDIEFQLRTIDDALTEILSYASAYIFCDAEGVVHIQKGAKTSPWQFITGPSGIVTKGTHELSDENTRDVAKVWGFKGQAVRLRPGESPFIIVEDSVDLGLPVHKTVIYSSNYLQTEESATRLAREIISDLGKFDSVKTVEIVGNPDINIGHKAWTYLDLETSVMSGYYTITGIDSDLSKEGYQMRVVLDKFCPKFAGWEINTPYRPIFACTDGSGIFRSMDNGFTWLPFNSGFSTTGSLVAAKCAFNDMEEGVAIVNSRLYSHTGVPGEPWKLAIVEDPTIGVDDPKHDQLLDGVFGRYVTVDSLGMDGAFYLLTARVLGSGGDAVGRSWLYTSEWYTSPTKGKVLRFAASTPVHDDTDYDHYAIDMDASGGFPYIITSRYSADVPPPPPYPEDFPIGGGTYSIQKTASVYSRGGTLPDGILPTYVTRWLNRTQSVVQDDYGLHEWIGFPTVALESGTETPLSIFDPSTRFALRCTYYFGTKHPSPYEISKDYNFVKVGLIWGLANSINDAETGIRRLFIDAWPNPNLNYADAPTPLHSHGSYIISRNVQTSFFTGGDFSKITKTFTFSREVTDQILFNHAFLAVTPYYEFAKIYQGTVYHMIHLYKQKTYVKNGAAAFYPYNIDNPAPNTEYPLLRQADSVSADIEFMGNSVTYEDYTSSPYGYYNFPILLNGGIFYRVL